MHEGWSDDKDIPELLRQSRVSGGRKKRGGGARTTPTAGHTFVTKLGATKLN